MPKPRYQTPTIHQSKNGSYFIRPWIDVLTDQGLTRRKKTIVLGPSALGRRGAVAARNQIMAKLNRSDYVIQSQIKLADFLVRYKNLHFEKLAASSRAKYQSHLKKHIEPAFAHLMLSEITTQRVDDWLLGKEREGLSWSTRTDLRNILSSVFTKATDWGHWQDKNPIERVSVGRRRLVREKRKLTDEQTRQLLAALPFDVRLACSVALFGTLRISEILGLQEKHLDFEHAQIRVRQRYYRGDLDIPKNAKAVRDVPMGYLVEDLRRMCKGDPDRFVFQIKTHLNWKIPATTRDGRDIQQHFLRPAAKALGIYWKGFGFHALRREAVTAASAAMGIGQAMSLAGHNSVDMSLLYTLRDCEEHERAVRAHQERILGKPESPVQ